MEVVKDVCQLEFIKERYRLLTNKLIEYHMTISTMESITAGQVISLLTDTPGASAVVKGGFVTYCNEAKISQGVPREILEKYGVYSKETALAMAKACQRAYDTTIGIGITGTAGNVDLQNIDSKIGEVYLGIVMGEDQMSEKLCLKPDQERIHTKLRIAAALANLLLEQIEERNNR